MTDGTTFVGRGYEGAVDRGDEALVVGAGALHRLNPSAALLWRLWRDPADPVTITAELADATGLAPDVVGPDVVAAMAGLLAAGLLEPVVAGSWPGLTILEPVPACSGCGPGPDYECHVLVDTGAAVLALGADRELAAALATGFGAATIGVQEPEGRASYGVVVPTIAPGPIRDLARLHRGPDVLARARDPYRIVRALVDQVGAHLVPPEVLTLDAVAVVRDDAAALVPVPRDRARFDRACRAAGVRASDGAVVAVAGGPDGPEVVLGAPWTGFAFDAVTPVLDPRRDRDESDLGAEPGRYRLTRFGVGAEPGFGRVLGEMGPGPATAAGDVAGRLLALVEAVDVVEATGPEVLADRPA